MKDRSVINKETRALTLFSPDEDVALPMLNLIQKPGVPSVHKLFLK